MSDTKIMERFQVLCVPRQNSAVGNELSDITRSDTAGSNISTLVMPVNLWSVPHCLWAELAYPQWSVFIEPNAKSLCLAALSLPTTLYWVNQHRQCLGPAGHLHTLCPDREFTWDYLQRGNPKKKHRHSAQPEKSTLICASKWNGEKPTVLMVQLNNSVKVCPNRERDDASRQMSQGWTWMSSCEDSSLLPLIISG